MPLSNRDNYQVRAIIVAESSQVWSASDTAYKAGITWAFNGGTFPVKLSIGIAEGQGAFTLLVYSMKRRYSANAHGCWDSAYYDMKFTTAGAGSATDDVIEMNAVSGSGEDRALAELTGEWTYDPETSPPPTTQYIYVYPDTAWMSGSRTTATWSTGFLVMIADAATNDSCAILVTDAEAGYLSYMAPTFVLPSSGYKIARAAQTAVEPRVSQTAVGARATQTGTSK